MLAQIHSKDSQPVYFNVCRATLNDKSGTVIPYERFRLNVGGGMNAATGVFTAPKDCNYHFMFTERAYGTEGTRVDMLLNGGQLVLTRAYRDQGANSGGTLATQTIGTLKTGRHGRFIPVFWENV